MRSQRLLVVDDEPGIRAAVQATLRSVGLCADAASGVRDAQARIAQCEYELILSDMRMSDGTGIDLLRFVRNRNRKVPFVFFTAYGNISDAVDAMKQGACDYLLKPIASEHLT